MTLLSKYEGSKRYIGNLLWLLFEKVFRMGLVFLVTAYIARYLGPKDFGVLSYAQSFVALFAAFASLGVDQIVTREVVAKRYDLNKLLGTCFILKLVGAFLVAVCTLAVSRVANESELVTLIVVLVALGTFFQAGTTVSIYFQAVVNSKPISIAQVVALVLSSAFKLTLVYINAELVWFGVAFLLDAFFSAMLLLTVYVIKERSIFSWRFDRVIALSLLKESWPLIISSAVIAVYTRIDQVMLKHMVDETAVGVYAVAVRVSEATGFLPAVLITAFFPAVAAAKEKSEAEYNRAILRFFSLIAYSGLALALFVTVISPWLIALFFGNSYEQSIDILRVHMWGMFFSFVGTACTQWLVIEGLTRYRLYRTVLGVVTNIVLNLVLIPKYGVIGAAYATLVSQIVASYLGNLFSRKTVPVFVLQTRSFILRG